MTKKEITSPLAPKAIGPYSQAIEIRGQLYVSGQLGVDASTGELVQGGITEQAHQVFKNISYVLKEAGYSFDEIVKCTVLLESMDDFPSLNAVYEEYFSAPYPARACYAVRTLPKNALVEIELVAVK